MKSHWENMEDRRYQQECYLIYFPAKIMTMFSWSNMIQHVQNMFDNVTVSKTDHDLFNHVSIMFHVQDIDNVSFSEHISTIFYIQR